MYIYVDIVLIINIIMNSIILLLTAWTMRVGYKTWRLLAAASAGALYVLAGLLFQAPLLFEPLFKVLVSFLIIVIAFGRRPLRILLLLVGIFFIVSFMLGGAVLGWLFFWQSGNLMQVIARFKAGLNVISWRYLAGGGAFGAILIGVMLRNIVRRLICFKTVYKARVQYGGRAVEFKGMLDTGNSLYTPIGRRPVVLVNQAAIEAILDERVRNYLRSNPPDSWLVNLEKCDSPDWLDRVQVIPCRAVSGSGMLLGFRPDSIEVTNENEVVKTTDVVLGIYGGMLSSEGLYEALLHPAVIQT